MIEHHEDIPYEPPTIEAFFEDLLPEAIAAQPRNFDAVNASLCINVHGAGAWVVHFGNHLASQPIESGLNLDADLIATFSKEGFHQLLEGDCPENPDEPLLLGDATLLERFGRLLLPPVRGGLF